MYCIDSGEAHFYSFEQLSFTLSPYFSLAIDEHYRPLPYQNTIFIHSTLLPHLVTLIQFTTTALLQYGNLILTVSYHDVRVSSHSNVSSCPVLFFLELFMREYACIDACTCIHIITTHYANLIRAGCAAEHWTCIHALSNSFLHTMISRSCIR